MRNFLQENSEEMSLFEQLPKKNAEKAIPPASKTNVFNEKGPKGGQRPPQLNKEKIPPHQKLHKRDPIQHNTQKASKTEITNINIKQWKVLQQQSRKQ